MTMDPLRRNRKVLVVAAAVLVVLSVGAWVVNLPPYEEPPPTVHEGIVTKMYIVPGKTGGTGTAIASDGTLVTVTTFGTSATFYIVLNEEDRFWVTQDQYDKLHEGDVVTITETRGKRIIDTD